MRRPAPAGRFGISCGKVANESIAGMTTGARCVLIAGVRREVTVQGQCAVFPPCETVAENCFSAGRNEERSAPSDGNLPPAVSFFTVLAVDFLARVLKLSAIAPHRT